MASKIKIKTKLSGDVADVKCLLLHPMETGSRKDPDTGKLIPNFSTAISVNPYFGFKFGGAKAGDTLKISWIDNQGGTDEVETTL